jgi:hypothetical protein
MQQQQMAAATMLNMQMQRIPSRAPTNTSRQVGMQDQATSRGSRARSSTRLVPVLTRVQERQMLLLLPSILQMLHCISPSSSSRQ